jgi:hypothetical protein
MNVNELMGVIHAANGDVLDRDLVGSPTGIRRRIDFCFDEKNWYPVIWHDEKPAIVFGTRPVAFDDVKTEADYLRFTHNGKTVARVLR